MEKMKPSDQATTSTLKYSALASTTTVVMRSAIVAVLLPSSATQAPSAASKPTAVSATGCRP